MHKLEVLIGTLANDLRHCVSPQFLQHIIMTVKY